MNNVLNFAKSTRLQHIEGLIDFTKYPADEDGWNQFVLDAKELFQSRDSETKQAVRKCGGYPAIFDTADIYFQLSGSTVAIITEKFHNLLAVDQTKVKGDSSGYRFKIAERFSDEYERFAYPSDFLVAYDLVLTNLEVL